MGISYFIVCSVVSAYCEGENLAALQQPELLLELLQLVFQQFRVVARIHQIIIANMQRLKVSTRTPQGHAKYTRGRIDLDCYT